MTEGEVGDALGRAGKRHKPRNEQDVAWRITAVAIGRRRQIESWSLTSPSVAYGATSPWRGRIVGVCAHTSFRHPGLVPGPTERQARCPEVQRLALVESTRAAHCALKLRGIAL